MRSSSCNSLPSRESPRPTNNYFKYNSRGGKWQSGLYLYQNFGTVEQGKFVQRLWQLNLAYSFNPNIVPTSFLQYDSESQDVGNNLGLRWTIKPGSNLFIVWNRSWQRLVFNPAELSIIPDSELLAVKLRWTFGK